MPWLLAQPWYWQCRISRPLSYWRKDFNYPCHIILEEWHEMYYMLLAQPWYWQCRISWPLSYWRKYFNYPCHIILRNDMKCIIYVYVPFGKFSTLRVNDLATQGFPQQPYHLPCYPGKFLLKLISFLEILDKQFSHQCYQFMDGLVPSGNKPLPGPMLSKITVAIRRH